MPKQTEGYESKSTIDSPPRYDQDEIPGTEEETDSGADAALSMETPKGFTATLTLTLKGLNGNPKPQSLPILHGDIPSDLIEEMLEKAFESKYFRARLRAVIGTIED